MVKLGGYDEFCMSQPDDFVMIDTMDNEEWALKANWGRVGGPG